MSSLTKPGATAGTPVDPVSPGGILIDPTTEISGSPALNEVIKGDGLGGWTIGLLSGALTYKGTWNAATNTPALPLGGEIAGDYYIVSVAGSTNLDGITDWAPADWAIHNGTVFQKIDNSDVAPNIMELSTNLGVPNAGTRFLDRAGVACTSAPILLPTAAILRGLTISVNAADGVRDYAVEVVSDPAGTPVLIGSALALPSGSVSAYRRDLSAAIVTGVLWGVRVVRTLGTGPSTFTNLRVEVEVQMP